VPDGRPAALCPAPGTCRDLLELLAGVTDGRAGRGRHHPVAAVLALAAAAVVAGYRSFTANRRVGRGRARGCAGRPVPAVRGHPAGGRAAVESHDLAGGHRD